MSAIAGSIKSIVSSSPTQESQLKCDQKRSKNFFGIFMYSSSNSIFRNIPLCNFENRLESLQFSRDALDAFTQEIYYYSKALHFQEILNLQNCKWICNATHLEFLFWTMWFFHDQKEPLEEFWKLMELTLFLSLVLGLLWCWFLLLWLRWWWWCIIYVFERC